VNPFYPVYKSYFIWFIAYAFGLFTTGITYSSKIFTISAFIILAGIPITLLFPQCQYIIAGAFLGACLIIPSLVECKRLGYDK